jgi:hypothetical protein
MDERTKPADQHDHESTTRSGEEVANSEQEAGRTDGPDKGQTGRPTGTSTARDYTGVNPKEPITKDDPAG